MSRFVLSRYATAQLKHCHAMGKTNIVSYLKSLLHFRPDARRHRSSSLKTNTSSLLRSFRHSLSPHTFSVTLRVFTPRTSIVRSVHLQVLSRNSLSRLNSSILIAQLPILVRKASRLLLQILKVLVLLLKQLFQVTDLAGTAGLLDLVSELAGGLGVALVLLDLGLELEGLEDLLRCQMVGFMGGTWRWRGLPSCRCG